MDFEDNLDVFQSIEFPPRTNIPSPIDNNSRDSGFEDASFLEEFAEFEVSTDSSRPMKQSIVTVTVEEKPSFRSVFKDKTNRRLRKKTRQSPENFGEVKGFFSKRKKTVSSHSNVSGAFGSEEAIKSAIQRSYSEPDLIANFSKTYSLPLTPSRHKDLKAISSNTLKQLLNGEFNDRVDSFKIIDCRYPYEYNGGHIKNAINVYTREQCTALLEESSSRMSEIPEILIFHCEFSSKRGPNLYRYLRQEDRRQHVQTYPSLCFPEIYILEGGYKNFFQENASMCYPSLYTPMLDPRHGQDLAYFSQLSRTWDSDVNKFTDKKQMKNVIVRQFVL